MTIKTDSEKIREKCGVLGIYLNRGQSETSPISESDAGNLAYYGLHNLQHRGREACGIAAYDGENFSVYRGKGLVAEVFDREKLAAVKGHMALGHVLYSLTPVKSENIEPYVSNCGFGSMALVHNGALTNGGELRKTLKEQGESFVSSSETEIISKLITRNCKKGFEKALSDAVQSLEGSFALCVMTEKCIVGARDPRGIRPLCLGKLENGWVLSSETSGLDAIGAELVRDVNPGEIVIINEDGVLSFEFGEREEKRTCVFEYAYFARPDSIIDGIPVQEARLRMGATLAAETAVDADVVIGVPDSGLGAAMGYAAASGIPYALGIVKNRNMRTSYIPPKETDSNAFVKLNVVKSDIEGKRVVIVDDSLPGFSTIKNLVYILRRAGATEVHYRVASPMVKSFCHYGIDIPSRKVAVSESYTEYELAEEIGASSIAFLSVDGMLASLKDIKPENFGYCTKCFLLQ